MANLSDREFRHATRRRQAATPWDLIADELGWTSGGELARAFDRKRHHDAGARQTLATRRVALPSIAIGQTGLDDETPQSRGALARRVSAMRSDKYDPLDDMIHPSAMAERR